VYGLLDGTSRLRQPLVVDRPAPTLGCGFAKLVERDLVEVLDDQL
jgi:hypothetical protein